MKPKILQQQDLFLKLIHNQNPTGLSDHITAAGSLRASEALNIYIQDYWLRLPAALADLFPSVARALGSDFKTLCDDYLSQYPSHHYNLDQIGASFPEFIRKHPLNQSLPFLSDLAELEKVYLNCFHAANSPEPDWELLQTQAPESLHLEFKKDIYRFDSPFQLLSLWLQSNQYSDDTQAQTDEMPQRFLVYPFQAGVRYLRISQTADRLFLVFQTESNIALALEGLDEAIPELDPIEVSSFFAMLRQEQLIERIVVK